VLMSNSAQYLSITFMKTHSMYLRITIQFESGYQNTIGFLCIKAVYGYIL